ncbi:MAG: dihydroorotate dehydrogenase [Clostridiales bacterium]|jgi:dihydroorotate dehydrogenase (NAD+) catalytic subunit|nr:dihydroorotate dehydrogenase [Clostridiales bacterium]
MNHRLTVDIAGVTLKNPIMPASGTFGSGKEYAAFVDLNRLGAIVVKGVASRPWPGNPPPRLAETASGMLNSVGLQNAGVMAFLAEDLPFLKQFDTKIIVNICGHSLAEYLEVALALSDAPVDLLELNISCPNVSEGGMAFGTNRQMVEQVVSAVKKHARQPLIVKLSPNVTDIVEIARAAESAGADGLSLINTLLGMKIDVHRRKPILANGAGGLSGPAIKPVAIRMVYQTARAVQIPIIGMGGVMTGEDAVEFLLAGASAVAVGTANFHNPTATVDVLQGLEAYMETYGIEDVNALRGFLFRKGR